MMCFGMPGLSCSTAGADFNQISAQLSLSANSLQQCVSVGIVDDTIFEDNEIFTAVLTTADPQVTVLDPPSAVITILDNDGIPVNILYRMIHWCFTVKYLFLQLLQCS